MSFMNTGTTSQSQPLSYNLLGADLENGSGFKSVIGANTAPISYQSIKSAFNFGESAEKVDNFEIEFMPFNHKFNFKIVDINWSLSTNSIIFQLKIEEHISVTASFFGRWQGQKNPQFHLESFSLKLNQKAETPTAVFLSSSLWAMLSLSNKLRVYLPNLGCDFTTSFELPLEETRALLKERQVAYRLMVIEKALATRLPFPHRSITGEEESIIAYSYHSIVDREFDWFWSTTTLPLYAIRENLSVLPERNEPTPIYLQPVPQIRSIFEHRLDLGLQAGEIAQAIVENYEEAKENLSKLDGNIVSIKVSSLNGLIKTKAIGTPHLPVNSWGKNIQKLVDLDKKLDEILLDRYFKLAASTLQGLTDEQKEAITQRPKLDATAFEF